MSGSIGPASIVLARVAGGAVVFAVIAWQRGTLYIHRRDVPAILGCALLGVAANQELFVQGLARSTATNASVLGATVPVFTAVVAISLRHEPLCMRRLVGISIAFGGVAALVGAHQMSLSSDRLVGNVMVLLNSLFYATSLVVVRPLARRYDPIALLAWLFIAAVPMVAPFGLVELAHAPPLQLADLELIAFLIAVPTVAAYGLVQIALPYTEASRLAAYIYLQPVITTLAAMVLLHEHPGPRSIVCGPIVLAGVWLAAKRAR